MPSNRIFKVSSALAALVFLSAWLFSEEPITSLADGQTGDVYYESYGGDVTLTGDVQLPDGAPGRRPAIILVHGSGGIGYRESTWGRLFRENGYVTMVIDMFGPRGFAPMSGPNVGGYDDVFQAFNLLKTHPRVDPDRISVMGWSWGGGIALSSAAHTKQRGGGHVLKSMVSFYPVCGVSAIPALGNPDAEILLVIGTKDTYTKAWQCEEIVDKGRRDGRRARLIVYDGAYHGFDGNKSTTFTHGKFGMQEIRADYGLAERAQKDVLSFLEAVGTPRGVQAEAGGGASGGAKPEACKTKAYSDLFPDVCS
jgi:dienelactone hydrolase